MKDSKPSHFHNRKHCNAEATARLAKLVLFCSDPAASNVSWTEAELNLFQHSSSMSMFLLPHSLNLHSHIFLRKGPIPCVWRWWNWNWFPGFPWLSSPVGFLLWSVPVRSGRFGEQISKPACLPTTQRVAIIVQSKSVLLTPNRFHFYQYRSKSA